MASTQFSTRQGSCCLCHSSSSSSASSSGRGSTLQLGELAFSIQSQHTIGLPGAFAAISLPEFQRRPGLNVLAWLGRKKLPTDAKFLEWLEAAKSGQLPAQSASKGAAEPRAPSYPDSWYNERCVFCASCNESINSSTREKSGIRCQGCRRWFHDRCRKSLPALPPLSHDEQQRQGQQGGGPFFFHCGECRRQYGALADMAAKGDVAMQDGRSVRLLELAAVKQEFQGRKLPSDAQIQRAWNTAIDSNSSSSSSNSSSSSSSGTNASARGATAGNISEAQIEVIADTANASSSADKADSPEFVLRKSRRLQQAVSGGDMQPVRNLQRQRPVSAVETFLAAAQLLNSGHFEEPAEDLMEDGFGLALRQNGQLVCAATFNLHAPDHARVQSMVTDAAARRQGHAAALLGELQNMLSSAGIKQLVVVLDEGTAEDGKAAQRLLRRRCGFVDIPPQQLVQWRNQLPEYHKQLLGGATLLVKPLE